MATAGAERSARRLRNSTWFHAGARTGFAVAGLLHVLIGVLAITIATRGGGGEADQSGALAALAATPAGGILLWVVVVGLLALGVWQILEAVTVSEPDPRKRTGARLKEAGKAVAYFAIGFTALGFARGAGGSSEQSTQNATAGMLSSPLGIVAVLAVAALAVCIGIGFVVSGVKEEFLRNIVVPPGATGRAVTAVGRVGYLAKGVAVIVVGLLFAWAALTADPSRAGGLDGALKALAALPFGSAILVIVGAGFIAYGAFFAVRAWRPRL
jgi:hypothetical protein